MHFNVDIYAEYTSSLRPFSTNYNLDGKLDRQRSRSPSLSLDMVDFFQAKLWEHGNSVPERFRGDLTQFSATGLANDQMG